MLKRVKRFRSRLHTRIITAFLKRVMYIFTITRYSRRHLKTDRIFFHWQRKFFADMDLPSQFY